MELNTLLFSFQGRINRAKYWLACLIYAGVGVVLLLIKMALGGGAAGGLLSFVINLAVFISGLAVAIKRLHDRDKSAWWLLLLYVLPTVLTIAIVTMMVMNEDEAATYPIYLLAPLAIWIWVIVELGCLRGTVGPNDYGPDPLASA